MFNLKLAFLLSIFSELYENVFTISLIFFQENILLGTPLAAKLIVLIIFNIQNIAFPEKNYVIIMFRKHSRVHRIVLFKKVY